MTDPLKDLKNAFDAATPAADPARKAATLARAQEIFDQAQGSLADPRPTPDRSQTGAGFYQGVRRMLSTMTIRPILGVTTALVAVGAIALMPQLLEQTPDTGTIELTEFDGLVDSRAPEVESAEEGDTPVLAEPEPVVVEQDFAFDDNVMALAEEAPTPPPPSPVPSPKVTPGPATTGFGNSTTLLRGGGNNTATIGEITGGVVTGSDFSLGFAPAEPEPDVVVTPEPDTEEFANEEDNPVKSVSEAPVSTFSIDVDTASYSVVRSSINAGQLPPPDAVRIEEMVNYFDYAYAAPEPGEGPFQPTVTVAETPWNPDTQLMTIALQGELPAVEDRPPLNLVFLIDTSGSMEAANKLPLLIQSFRLMLSELRPEDRIAIVTYAGSAGLALEATPASERATILGALENLQAGGSTAGEAGLQQAYSVAEAMAEEGDVTRVILATDGDFNVGINDPDALKDFIEDKRDSGTYLSVLGFGRGNLDDATMQALAQNGNGTAAYIDTLSEARKVLVDQLTGALFPIANDVKIQVEFNPASVAEYRLIGYETRSLRREDFNNDAVDAGEIGAGHSVTAIYEVTPVGSPAILNDPLRYGGDAPATVSDSTDELAFLRLRYKTPGEDESQLIELPIIAGTGSATIETDFAAAIAGFGQLLKDGTYTGDWGYAEAIALAQGSIGDDPFGYRRQAVELMRLAEALSQ